MAGLYLHIPFCRRRCHYCDFYFVLNSALIDDFTRALVTEIRSKAAHFRSTPIKTLYFGGGTPSMLTIPFVGKIMQVISDHFDLGALGEVTFEVNPEDLSKDYALGLREIGISRLSLGVQSLNDAKLKALSRHHTADQAKEAIELSLSLFPESSFDLMFGTPNESLHDWETELRGAHSFSPRHISLYGLTVEPYTLLSKLISRGKLSAPLDDLQAEMFRLGHRMLTQLGYVHYEISNYAIPGSEARHNSQYWNRIPYLGFGPSAHSFFTSTEDGRTADRRTANAASLKAYLENPLAAPSYDEVLTEDERFNELVLLGLRQMKGIARSDISTHFERASSIRVGQEEWHDMLHQWVQKGMICLDDTSIRLTEEGLLFADSIASSLFLSDSEVSASRH